MPPTILDAHIHLWPPTATTPSDHAWMSPSSPLAKQHTTREYKAATTAAAAAPAPPAAFIYVETDRFLASPAPDVSPTAAPEEQGEALRRWAGAPVRELEFLRGVVRGEGEDGTGDGEGGRLVGMVVWAPFGIGRGLFERYLGLVGEVLGEGEGGMGRVVGFRYLLQGRSAEEVRALIGNEWFVANVKTACERGRRRLAFDVGVDAHRDGVETLEAVVKLVENVGEGVTFVLNHLCKPDLSSENWHGFERWKAAVGRLSSHPNVYMKLSGALNEFAPATTPSSAQDILASLKPYTDHVLQSFGARRIMFGSDWPVCNVGGPKGEQGNWAYWAEVVEKWLEEKGLSEEEKEWVWAKSAASAYGIAEFR